MILKPLMRFSGFVYRISDRFGFTRLRDMSANFQSSIIRNCPHPEPYIIGMLDDGKLIVKECRLCGVGIVEDSHGTLIT